MLQDSQYWKDTEKAVESAQNYLLNDASVDYKKMVVFDIDETVLSNLEEILDAGIGEVSASGQVLLFVVLWGRGIRVNVCNEEGINWLRNHPAARQWALTSRGL